MRRGRGGYRGGGGGRKTPVDGFAFTPRVGMLDDPEMIGKRFVHTVKPGRPPHVPTSAIQEVPLVPLR
jgi:hypothetical protein